MKQNELFSLASRVAQRFSNLDCRRFASAFQAELLNNGVLQCQLVQLRTAGGEDFIVIRNRADARLAATADGTITRNGKHYGVQVGEHVFDNVLISGRTRAEWVAAFECRGGGFVARDVGWSEP